MRFEEIVYLFILRLIFFFNSTNFLKFSSEACFDVFDLICMLSPELVYRLLIVCFELTYLRIFNILNFSYLFTLRLLRY